MIDKIMAYFWWSFRCWDCNAFLWRFWRGNECAACTLYYDAKIAEAARQWEMRGPDDSQ